MNLTVYCMGDLPIFRDIINAVAMVFNSSLFDPTKGAGLVVIALLISLFLFALPAVMNKGLSPFPLIFVFLLYFGGVVPKTTLQIEDIYLGTVTTVDNVPIIVAVPASIAASIAKGITDTVETAFSSPSQGTYLSLGADGFVNPLKVLMAMRNVTAHGGGAMGFFKINLEQFVRDCAINAPGFSSDALNKSPDMIGGYLAGLPVTGITVYYSPAQPEGYVTSCPVVQSSIQTDLGALLTAGTIANPSAMDSFINGAVPPSGNSPGGVQSLSDAVNSVTTGSIAASQTAQQFMSNMLANVPVREGLKCANAATSGEVSSCTSQFLATTAIEQGNIDAATNASIFTKTAIPAMSILLALFYAFSPIIIGIAMLSGAHGIKIIAGFMMFGAWTQSWMPIAAVLNYMIQQQVQYNFLQFAPTGINLTNAYDFYNMLALKVGLASELLAMTPILSMALLSGSVFALSGVAGKFSQDQTDPKTLAPDYASTGSLGHQGARVEGDKATTLQQVGGGMGPGGAYTTINENNRTATDIDIASGAKSNVSNSIANRNAFAVQHAHSAEAKLAEAYKHGRESGDTQTTEAAQQQMFSEADKHAHQITDEMGKKAQFEESTKAGVSAELSAGIKFMGAGASIDAKKSFETAKSLATTDSQKDAITAAVEQARTQSMSMGEKFALSKSNKDATELSKNYGLTDSKSDTEMNESSASVTRALDEYGSFSGSQKVGSDVLGARAAQHMNADQFDQLNRQQLSSAQQARYNTMLTRHAGVISNANGGQPLNQQQRIDASIQSMNSIGASGQLLNTLVASGAVAADTGLLHNKERENGLSVMGVPNGVDVAQVRASTGGLNEGLVEQNAGQAAGNRGSVGVRYVPTVDSSGHATKHYQSETVAMQTAISGQLAGSPAADPSLNPDQQAALEKTRAHEHQNHGLADGETLEGHSAGMAAADAKAAFTPPQEWTKN